MRKLEIAPPLIRALIKVKPPLDVPSELLTQARDVVDEVVIEVVRDFGHRR